MTAALLKRAIPRSLKPIIRRQLGLPKPYNPYIAASIEEQTVSFRWRGRLFTIKSDRTTPVYETIAEVVDYDCYQLTKVAWPETPGCIVDIGANIGIAAVVLSQLPCRRVVCFEPLPDNCATLQSNIERNGIDNVTVVRAAISDVVGRASFEVSPASVGGRLADGKNTQPDQRLISVDCLRLSDALALCGEQNVDLLKVDCEGGEYSIVGQMTLETATRIASLTFEVHDLDSRRNCRSLAAALTKLGYDLQFKPDIFGRSNLHHILAVRPRPR